ncbi:hypothetical protein NXC14_PA00463 (plasmid) [Rhizobium sp. NXC14]|nr:hypothetical protein NXC14_PA00463 [Rhizobium sp. NXC14]
MLGSIIQRNAQRAAKNSHRQTKQPAAIVSAIEASDLMLLKVKRSAAHTRSDKSGLWSKCRWHLLHNVTDLPGSGLWTIDPGNLDHLKTAHVVGRGILGFTMGGSNHHRCGGIPMR